MHIYMFHSGGHKMVVMLVFRIFTRLDMSNIRIFVHVLHKYLLIVVHSSKSRLMRSLKIMP